MMTSADIEPADGADELPLDNEMSIDNAPIASRRPLRLVLGGVGVVAAVLIGGAIGVSRQRSSGDEITTSATGSVIDVNEVASASNPRPDSLDGQIAGLQTRLEAIPDDYVAWATLGIAYVQKAKVSVDPSFYPRADGALAESIALGADDNFLAYAGLSNLASARHDFDAAKEFAEQGLAINDFSAILYGALSDAELQLGNYQAAFDAVEKMTTLGPDTASFARASYTWELRGNDELARTFMEDALEAAPTPSDKAFALFQLGELEFHAGDPDAALRLYNEARVESPDDPQALAGKAKAEAATSQTLTALDHYAELVAQAPEPSYLIAYGELLESQGRIDDAEAQYDVFRATQTIFEANGVQADAAPVLFLAEHGEPEQALAAAESAIGERPFIAMYDAYAWALHKNDRNDEALVAIDEALSLGLRDASYLYHSGMIKLALGDTDGAIADLTESLERNPHFDPIAAPVAAETLAGLTGDAGN